MSLSKRMKILAPPSARDPNVSQSRNINQMPDLVVLSVFGHLPYRDMFLGAMLINKRFNELAREQLTSRRHLNILVRDDQSMSKSKPHFGTYFNLEDEHRWNSDSYSVHVLTLNANHNKSWRDVIHLVRLVPNVRHFRLRIEPKPNGPSVRDLVLSLNSVLVAWLRAPLLTVEVTNISTCASAAIYQLMETVCLFLPDLRHLRVKTWFSSIWPNPDSHRRLLDPLLSGQLESVHIANSNLAGPFVDTLMKLEETAPLRTIHLAQRFIGKDELFKLLSCDKLRDKLATICVSFSPRIDFATLERYLVGHTVPLSNLVNLGLYFDYPDTYPPPLHQLSQVLQHLPRLGSLTLSLNLTYYIGQYKGQSVIETNCVSLRSVRQLRLQLIAFYTPGLLDIPNGHSGQFDGEKNRCFRAPLGVIFAHLTHFRFDLGWTHDPTLPKYHPKNQVEMKQDYTKRLVNQLQQVLPIACQIVVEE